jgi:AcrR family transcriptional regulator
VKSSKKSVRRTQEDRSAATRARLLKAAVNSLYTRGYAATTTMIVCEDSGVSRGAMLHQFPSKVDLMLYVVKAVYEEDVALYQKALAPIEDPRERLLSFPEVAWQVLSRPAGVAVLEIQQGSRSDPALSARLKPLQKEIEQDSFRQTAAIIGHAGGRASAAATRLFVWALRGLSVARVLTDEPSDIDKSVKLLRELLIAATDAEVLNIPAASASRARKKRNVR